MKEPAHHTHSSHSHSFYVVLYEPTTLLMNPEYIALIITALIAFTGTLFKTTKDAGEKKTLVKWPNHIGWIIIILMLCSFGTSVFLKHEGNEKQRLRDSTAQVTDSLNTLVTLKQRAEDSISWAYSHQTDSINKLSLEGQVINLRALLQKSDSLKNLSRELSEKELQHAIELMLTGKYVPLKGVLVLRYDTQQERWGTEENEEYKIAHAKDTQIIYGSYFFKTQRERLFPEVKSLPEVNSPNEVVAYIDVKYGTFWNSRFCFYPNGKITGWNYYSPQRGLSHSHGNASNAFDTRLNELKFETRFDRTDTVHAAYLYKLINQNSLKITMSSGTKTMQGKKQTLSNWKQDIKEAYFLVWFSDRGETFAKIPLRIQSTSANTSNPRAEIIWVQSGKPQL